SCGPDAPTLASSSQNNCGRRWLSSPAHRGDHEVSRKTIVQGMPDCFGVPVVTTRVLSTFAHEAAGAPDTWHSLRPLSFLRGMVCKARADPAARTRNRVCSLVVAHPSRHARCAFLRMRSEHVAPKPTLMVRRRKAPSRTMRPQSNPFLCSP